jgi:hypothetical protein
VACVSVLGALPKTTCGVVARGVLEFTAPTIKGVYAEIASAPGLGPGAQLGFSRILSKLLDIRVSNPALGALFGLPLHPSIH